MADYAEQMELFQTAGKAEITAAKSMLLRYRRMKAIAEDFERNPPESPKQVATQEKAIRFVRTIDRAVNQIVDYDVRSVIEFRFLRANTRAATIIKYAGWDYCDKTIDRKIAEGIESVANSLLYL